MRVKETTPYDPSLDTPSRHRMRLADRVRERLFTLLGPKCAEYGCDLRECAWEVNHIWKREWSPRKLNRYRRHLRYWREAQEGLVNLLCAPCNSRFRPLPLSERTAMEPVEEPF